MKELYRGDRYNKGTELKKGLNDYVLNGEAKNQANWFFFSDSYNEAVEYATTAMNSQIRTTEATNPTITTVVAETTNLLDLTKFGGSVTLVEAYKILSELNGTPLTFTECAKFGLFGTGKLATLNDKSNRFHEVTTKECEELFAVMTGAKKDKRGCMFGFVDLSNFDCGVYFKEWLQENGYNGYSFIDRANMTNDTHYAFINPSDVQIVSQTELELEVA